MIKYIKDKIREIIPRTHDFRSNNLYWGHSHTGFQWIEERCGNKKKIGKITGWCYDIELNDFILISFKQNLTNKKYDAKFKVIKLVYASIPKDLFQIELEYISRKFY